MTAHYSHIFYETLALRVPLGVVVVVEGQGAVVRAFDGDALRKRLTSIRSTLSLLDTSADCADRALRSLTTRIRWARDAADLAEFHAEEAGIIRVSAPLPIVVDGKGEEALREAAASAEVLFHEILGEDALARTERHVADKLLAPGVPRPGPPVWKPCLAGRYEVSSCGEVRGARSLKMYRVHSSRTGDYVELLDVRGKKRAYCLAPLILQAFGSKRPSPKHQVEYRNGNPRDHHVTNLAWKETA